MLTILGVWKILGAIAILAPGFPRLKEWAYAGYVFDLTGAIVAQIMTTSAAIDVIIPIVVLILTGISWWLRPKTANFYLENYSAFDLTRSNISALPER